MTTGRAELRRSAELQVVACVTTDLGEATGPVSSHSIAMCRLWLCYDSVMLCTCNRVLLLWARAAVKGHMRRSLREGVPFVQVNVISGACQAAVRGPQESLEALRVVAISSVTSFSPNLHCRAHERIVERTHGSRFKAQNQQQQRDAQVHRVQQFAESTYNTGKHRSTEFMALLRCTERREMPCRKCYCVLLPAQHA